VTYTAPVVGGIGEASEIDAFAHGERHAGNPQAPPSFRWGIETPAAVKGLEHGEGDQPLES
jgi:hypothetical protein